MSCQDHLYRKMHPTQVSRRWFFEQCGVGVGAAALWNLLSENGYGMTDPADPLAPKKPALDAKAKDVIFLFVAGALSHLELFDYKPELVKFVGQLRPAGLWKGYRPA